MKKFYLDIDLLQTFVTVVDCNSFTVAGQRLHKTQSAISVKIKKLEHQMGQQLLDRVPPIRPTAAGQKLLPTARRLIEAHEDAFSALSQVSKIQHVTVGTSETYASTVLSPVLKIFRSAYPEIQIDIHCGHSWDILEAQTRNDIDLVVATRSPRHVGVTLKCQQLFWVCSENSKAYLDDCLPLAVFPAGCLYREGAVAALSQAKRSSRIACTSSHHDGLMAAIATGSVLTAIPESAIPAGCKKLDRSHGLPELPTIDVALYKGTNLSPVARRLGMAIEEHYLGAYADFNSMTNMSRHSSSTVK